LASRGGVHGPKLLVTWQGSEGVRIDVDAGGALVVTEGTTKRAELSCAAFTVNDDWFAEAVLSDSEAVVSLSKGNYASAGGSPAGY
jgi:hypothetical protein